ncbi:MAG: ADP-ribosylglycohydrolase family protein [Anaerolineae bacterium]|nr:ADP-ribosylglycohydrolase family protein [Anaerolineae bacterium]
MKLDNITLLDRLLAQGKIALQPSIFLKQSPSPLPENWDFERVEGMMLGLAIGDALGYPTEAELPVTRQRLHGEIRDYLPNQYAGGYPRGVPSDDTQMAFWTLEQLLEDGALKPGCLAYKFAQYPIFGMGSTIRDFLRSYKDQGRTWEESGQSSAGNGALMRIAPVLIPHLRRPSPALWADAALASMITHNDRDSNACCIAFIQILWECLRLNELPEPTWWVDAFVAAAGELEGNTLYSSRIPELPYQGPLWQFVDREVRQALKQNLSTLEACQRWHSGAYLLETMPCVLYILARHGDNPEEAIIRAVNDTKDNDTIAAIVGAAVGALHGRTGLPARWISGLLGRTREDDDWRIFELIESAKQTFWRSDPPLTPENIQAVLKFLPHFEQPDFSPGVWVTKRGSLPYFDYTSEVLDFIKSLAGNGFIQPFDWMNWQEGKQLVNDSALLKNVNLQTLRKLLAAHVRADRFSEGHLAAMFESGHITMILKRMAEIFYPKVNMSG